MCNLRELLDQQVNDFVDRRRGAPKVEPTRHAEGVAPWRGEDVASRSSASGNTLHALRHLANADADAIGFDLEDAVFELTRQNLAILGLPIDVLHIDYSPGLSCVKVADPANGSITTQRQRGAVAATPAPIASARSSRVHSTAVPLGATQQQVAVVARLPGRSSWCDVCHTALTELSQSTDSLWCMSGEHLTGVTPRRQS